MERKRERRRGEEEDRTGRRGRGERNLCTSLSQ